MAERYSFFNSKDHDRKYNARHWADYFAPLFKSGVFNGDLQVTANDDMTITINKGYAWIDGYAYHLTEPITVDLETASGNMNRVDNIKIRLDLTNRWIKHAEDTGNYYSGAAIPKDPEVTATIHDLIIARVNVAAGTTAITQDMITDTRMDDTLCGWVCGAVDQIDFSQIYAQFNKYFEKQKTKIAFDVEDFEEEIDQKQTAAGEYLQVYKDSVDDDKTAADASLENFKQYLQNYTSQQQSEFEAWVETIKGILDDETAGKLLLYIQELQERADVMEKIAATNEVIQNMTTSDDELIVTDDGERICARKIFATL